MRQGKKSSRLGTVLGPKTVPQIAGNRTVLFYVDGRLIGDGANARRVFFLKLVDGCFLAAAVLPLRGSAELEGASGGGVRIIPRATF